MDWCRDIDYGSLPQWVTIGLGAVAAFFTIRGYLLSQQSFRQDVRLREYAQARLVYAQVVEVQNFRTGVSFHQPITDRKVQIVNLPSRSGEIPWHFTVAEGSISPIIHGTPQRDGRAVLIRIHNTSEELISRVDVRVVDGDYEVGGTAANVLLAPASSTEWLIATDALPIFNPTEATVTFTDAVGKKWIRRGGQPVEPFPPADQKKARTKFRDPARNVTRRLENQKGVQTNGTS